VPDHALSFGQIRDFLTGNGLEVSREVEPGDPMYAYNPELYFFAGSEALRVIRLAMLAAQIESVDSVLDFACGSGRVLRVLTAAFPGAEFTACDRYPEGVRFCADKLGATGVISDNDARRVRVGGPFDLIWCGSLLTHLDKRSWPRLRPWLRFLELFESVLAPGGLVVFTVYGRSVAKGLRERTNTLDLEGKDVDGIVRDYEKKGFGFRRTRTGGDTLVSRPWVCEVLDRLPSLDLVLYLEHGWIGQDVIACVKRGVRGS
jgi:SAM-dependent methyltransferase